MQLIATRVYHDRNPRTGEEYELRDRMLRKGERSFVLMVAGELPGDPEVELAYSLEEVFGWFRDCPQQIERAVIMGGGTAELAERPRAGRRGTAGPLALTVARRQGESQNATV
jgi:hypothetical protein